MTSPYHRVRLPERALRRVIIEAVSPEVTCARYPAKRIVGDEIVVECDLVADGHDAIAGRVLYRHAIAGGAWQVAPLSPLGNDRWRASFVATLIGPWEVTFEAWIDAFTTWRIDTEKKRGAGHDIAVELLIGARLLEEAALRAAKPTPELQSILDDAALSVGDTRRHVDERLATAKSERVVQAMARSPDLTNATFSE